MVWSDEAWRSISDIYARILSGPFIEGLVTGTLSKARFDYYLEQDVLYLRDYSKTLAILAGKMPTLQGTADFSRFAASVEAAELLTHEHFLGPDHPDAPVAPTCLMYRSFLLRAAAVEPVEVLAATVLPCFWIYERVGHYAKEKIGSATSHQYYRWITSYSTEEFDLACAQAIKWCDELAAAATPEIRQRMTEAFRMASELEDRFWTASYALEQWHHVPVKGLSALSFSSPQATRLPSALSIAGSDPSGGAGIQADIKAMSALGVYAQTAVTAVVDENTQGVYGVHAIPTAFVQGQIRSCAEDIGVDAVKIGMLHSAELVVGVRDALREHVAEGIPIVLDPVMVATSGDKLLQDDAVATLRAELLPLATLVTPNIPEAAILLDITEEAVKADLPGAARGVAELAGLNGQLSVFLKAGHVTDSATVEDVLYDATTGQTTTLSSPRVTTRNTHGTGCTLSSALAALLARGLSVSDASHLAKDYIAGAIVAAVEYEMGRGHGPVHHFYNLWA